METFTLIVAVFGFLFGVTAYWRSGGKTDITRIRSELENLRAKQRDLAQSVSESLSAAYDRSRSRLQTARDVLRTITEEAVDDFALEVKLTQEQLEALAAKLEAMAKAVGETTLSAAQKAEQALALRIRRIEARATLLQAKAKALRAVALAEKKEFDRTDQLLEEATDRLRRAREILADDHARDELLDRMKLSLRSATVAVRSRAAEARLHVEAVLKDADRIVTALESDETSAARTSA